MEWLAFRDPNDQNKTRVDVYREKQVAYSVALERKAEAYGAARRGASTDPLNTDVGKQREAYDLWVERNHEAHNNLIRAAYMDWVAIAKKAAVEYYFSIVDNDSAMARVEASKVDSLLLSR